VNETTVDAIRTPSSMQDPVTIGTILSAGILLVLAAWKTPLYRWAAICLALGVLAWAISQAAEVADLRSRASYLKRATKSAADVSIAAQFAASAIDPALPAPRSRIVQFFTVDCPVCAAPSTTRGMRQPKGRGHD